MGERCLQSKSLVNRRIYIYNKKIRNKNIVNGGEEMGKSNVLVDLEKARHLSILGDTGYGKTRYVRRIVDQVLEDEPETKVVVFGSRDESWKQLEHMGLITLYSMEDTIKGRLLAQEYPHTDNKTLVVVEDIWHTLQLLPSKEHNGVVEKLHELLTRQNVRSIVTSLRPIEVYYPREILELANVKIALRMEYDYDYDTFFGTQAYKDEGKLPEEVGQAFIQLHATHDPVYINNSQRVQIK